MNLDHAQQASLLVDHRQRHVLATLAGAPPVWFCARVGLTSIQAECLEWIARVGDVRGLGDPGWKEWPRYEYRARRESRFAIDFPQQVT